MSKKIASNPSTMTVVALVVAVLARAAVAWSEPCPSAMEFQAPTSGTTLDAGWTGLMHDTPYGALTLRTGIGGCANAAVPCGECTITGLLPNTSGGNQRCTNNTAVRCTNDTPCFQQCSGGGNDGLACASDVNCPSGKCVAAGTCAYFFGSNLPAYVGGVSVCLTNEVSGSVGGTVNLDTGSVLASVPLKSSLYNGILVAHPCPSCDGDATPNDDVLGGTCNGGARAGRTCDANGAPLNVYSGATSFDCPPLPGALIGTLTDTVVGLDTDPGTDTQTSKALSAASPNCRAFGHTTEKCFCDTCNSGIVGVSTVPCASNADCPDPPGPIGPICGGKRCRLGTNAGAACNVASECPGGLCDIPGQPTQPNTCLDSVCTATSSCVGGSNAGADCGVASECPGGACSAAGEGTCAAGPIDFYCGPHATFRGCLSDGDCAFDNVCLGGSNAGFSPCTVASQCPGGVCEIQICTTLNIRNCYTDNGSVGQTVSVHGAASAPVGNVFSPTLGALYCLGATTSSAANNAVGLPGLGRLLLQGTATLADVIVSQTVPGGGPPVTTPPPTVTNPVQTSVSSPNGGVVTIYEQNTSGAPPGGFQFLDKQSAITAPPASAASPLVITFEIDASIVPAVPNPQDAITVFKTDGATVVEVLACTGAGATPDPCVASRTLLGSGNVEIVIRTSSASIWNFAVPTGGPTPTATPTPTPTPTPGAATLDHFTCYKAGATSHSIKFPGIPGLPLIDQFGPSTIEVKKPKFLCAPTDKNNENPGAELHPEHLEGYQIKNFLKPPFPTNITVTDQFNPGGIKVDAKKQSHLLVPTVKDLITPPPTPGAFTVDHFECYKVSVTPGTPKFVAVLALPIKDQFGVMTVDVKKPKFLCNPVDKNGENPGAELHPEHLLCYQVKQTDLVKFVKRVGVFVNNQFEPETLDVKKPSELCVPAVITP